MLEQTIEKADGSSCLSPYRNRLLNISIVSAEAEDYITVKRKSSEELLRIRPTLHVFQISPFGTLKTTTADRLRNYCTGSRENHPFLKVSSATAPSIAGSIDKKFRVIPPLNANFPNGTIVVDEFKTNPAQKSDAIGAALDVLESEESSRSVARKPNKSLKSRDEANVQYEIANGRIRFWDLRSNWIFMTARHLQKNRSLAMAMLLSRTIPIYYNPSLSELDAIDDNPSLNFRPLHLKTPKLETIDNPTYLEIRQHVRNFIEKEKIPKSYYFRSVCDCVRAYVFNGYKHDFELYGYILASKSMFVNDFEKAGIMSSAELEMETENAILESKKPSL